LNSKTIAVLKKIEGKSDSLELLAEIVGSSDAPLALRVSSAIGLAPYQHPKAPKFLKHRVNIPPARTIAEAVANIALIGSLVGQKKLGTDEAKDLTDIHKAYIEAQANSDLEARIAALEAQWQAHPIVPGIEVVGGLPNLPLAETDGELIMPRLVKPNGDGDDDPPGSAA
jgi:hypothetical protein